MAIMLFNKTNIFLMVAASVLLTSACSTSMVNTEDNQYSANSHYCKSLRSELNNGHANGYSSLKPNQNSDGFEDEKYQGENHRLQVERAYEKDCESPSAYQKRTTIDLDKE